MEYAMEIGGAVVAVLSAALAIAAIRAAKTPEADDDARVAKWRALLSVFTNIFRK